MRYIIMAGGDYVRWETPRHLLEIMGEPKNIFSIFVTKAVLKFDKIIDCNELHP